MRRRKIIKKDILNGNLAEQIMLITIPITGSYIIQQLYQFVDSIVLGRYASVEALAAIGGSATMIINVILNIICGIATGVMIIVAQNYGNDNDDGVRNSVRTGMFVAVVFGGIISILSAIGSKPLLHLMNCPEEIIHDSLIYMYFYFAAIIPYSIYTFGLYILRATGDTKISTLFTIIIAVTKIALDLLLTAVFKMGVWGVSISTIASYLICGIIVLIILNRSTDSYQYTIKEFGYDNKILKNIFKIGIPIAIQSAAFAITNAYVSVKINAFGTNAIAAFGAYNNVDNFYWSFSNAIGSAVITIIGQNYGNKNYKRVKEALKYGIIIDAVASILIGVFEYFCGIYVIELFTTNIDVINIANNMVQFISKVYITYLFVEMISGTIKGCGDSMNSMIIALIGICGVRFAYLTFVKFTDVVQVLYCYPISWLITSIIYLMYYLLNKKYKKLLSHNN